MFHVQTLRFTMTCLFSNKRLQLYMTHFSEATHTNIQHQLVLMCQNCRERLRGNRLKLDWLVQCKSARWFCCRLWICHLTMNTLRTCAWVRQRQIAWAPHLSKHVVKQLLCLCVCVCPCLPAELIVIKAQLWLNSWMDTLKPLSKTQGHENKYDKCVQHVPLPVNSFHSTVGRSSYCERTTGNLGPRQPILEL